MSFYEIVLLLKPKIGRQEVADYQCILDKYMSVLCTGIGIKELFMIC